MREYLTVAEVYRMQHRLIELFGGLHGVRDAGGIEAAVFRPQTGYYDSVEEEAAALMEENQLVKEAERRNLLTLLIDFVPVDSYGQLLQDV